MKALSVQNPWAWALIHGPKRIENRSQRTHHRGRLLIQAGKSRRRLNDGKLLLPNCPPADDLVFGAIIGTVDLVDCVPVADIAGWLAKNGWAASGRPPASESDAAAQLVLGFPPAEPGSIDLRFADGPWCWIMMDPRPFRNPIPWRGMQGMFNVPDSIVPDEILTVGPNGIWAN